MIFETTLVFFSGLVAMVFSTFSGGGAMLTIPVLIFVGLTPAVAVATNRFSALMQSAARLPFLHKRLGLGFKIPAAIVFFHAIGAVIGALILVSLDVESLFKLLGVTLVVASILTFLSEKGVTVAKKKDISLKSLIAASIAMFFVGIYRGFFGPATAILDRLVSIHFLGLDFVQSMALSNYNTFFSSIAALAIFLNAGLVNFAFGIPLAVGAVIGAVFGTKYALEKGNVFMKYAFVAISVITGGYFIFFRVG